MAISLKQLPIFLTLAAIFSIFHAHARDSQFFNKVPTTTNTVSIPTGKQQQQEPGFLPEDENNYGLFGHESGQLPPSAATTAADESDQHKYRLPKDYNSAAYGGAATSGSAQPLPKYLPKNYNPVAYVTVPEGTDDNEDDSNSKGNGNNVENYHANNNDDNDDDNVNYFNSQLLEQEAAYRSYPTNVGGGNYNNRAAATGIRSEGMSDTRSLENGKYFYDVSAGNFGSRHPYERLKGSQRNYYGSQENSGYGTDQFSSQDFQNEEKYNTP